MIVSGTDFSENGSQAALAAAALAKQLKVPLKLVHVISELGAQAQQVLQRARRPVILVPPEREG